MKFLFDLFPVIVFVAIYWSGAGGDGDSHQAILWATGGAIIASLLQVAYLAIRYRRVEKMYLVTAVLLLVLGGATLLLQDERYIKWKPTAVNWAFAIAFIGSELFTAKNLIQRMLEGQIEVPDAIWTRLNHAWAGFFIVMGALNLWVAFSFATDIWVNFKLFGVLGLTFVFALGQG
ncbi:MAG: septation protein A, partial [Gammaproteobacteria bacterium]|nr:septation protein A [Gammaproteobacteria bacterium]